MKISLNWLREFVNIPSDIDPQKLATLFTLRTAEIEGLENQAADFEHIVVGQILEIHPHPNADKLKITKTSIGKETLQIVCGDPTIREGMYVPVALIGAKVHWHGVEEKTVIQAGKIRGVESYGMICAGEEIGLEEKSTAVYDLSPLNPEAGQPLSDLLKKNDVIFTVDNKSLTHRPDLWGHYGIARELAAILDEKLQPYITAITFPNEGTTLEVQIKEPQLCPRYLGVLIENITIGPSPVWLQSKLKAIGYRSINNIVDATNYVMAELGQPLHAFDAQKIDKSIVVRKATEAEEIKTLDGVARKLSSDMLVVADDRKVLAIAGVMGGADSEVDDSTTRIFIEAANFQPSSVRKTSVKLGLRTEAVQRFEKSLDPEMAEVAMNKLCEIIVKLCPDAIINPKLDVKNFEQKKIVLEVDLKKVFSKIGIEMSVAKVIDILQKLEFEVEEINGKPAVLKVEVPSFRATKDIGIEDDIVEEIARMYGYENIEARLPELPIKLPFQNKDRTLKHQVRQILATGMGFDEVYNYSFYSLSDIKKALLPEELHIRVKNYLSEDQTHLRISLLPNILKNIQHNLKSLDHFKLFEIGRTYENLQEYFPVEEKKICAAIVSSLPNNQQGFLADPFYEAKGILESFLKIFRIVGLEMRKGESFCPYAHPNKYLQYFSRKTGDEIAKVYEIHPLVAKNYDLEKAHIVLFEVNFTKLVDIDQQEIKYKPIPKFPGIEFDVSVVIDKKTEIGPLQKLIQKASKELIKEVTLFDLYEGENIGTDKKSLAFKIRLQAADRTLTDEEMKQIQQKIFSDLQNAGGEIRGLKA